MSNRREAPNEIHLMCSNITSLTLCFPISTIIKLFSLDTSFTYLMSSYLLD